MRSTVVAFACFVCLIGNQGAIAQTGVVAAASGSGLSLSAIKDDQDVWPASVTVTQTIEFSGGVTLNKGEQFPLLGFHDNGELHLDYRGEYTFTLPAQDTDLVQRASDIASGKAKAAGFQGRLAEQLDRKVYIKDGGNLRTASADEIGGADFYLFYHSSAACRWSGRFTPDLVKTVERLRAQYPGKMEVIYVSSDRNMQELQTHLETVGATGVIPPRPDWYIDTFSALHPAVRQINQPSFMLMNANGRLIDSGMRRDSNYDDMFSALEALPERLANDAPYVPQWSRRAAPIRAVASTATSAQAVVQPARVVETSPLQPGKKIENTDPSIVGPVPYTTSLRDGTLVPGLVMYDAKSSGNRIPALTLQAFPPHDGEAGFYRLAFRQVLGKTRSKPILAGWITSQTRKGVQADADLAMLVDHYKKLHAKFQEWRDTAISNNVSDFEKELYVVPNSYFATRLAAGKKGDTDLEIYFKVFKDPQKAVLKGARWSLTYGELDAFERLIPQIDALITQMPAEIVRTAEAKAEQEEDAKKTDALFN